MPAIDGVAGPVLEPSVPWQPAQVFASIDALGVAADAMPPKVRLLTISAPLISDCGFMNPPLMPFVVDYSHLTGETVILRYLSPGSDRIAFSLMFVDFFAK